MSRLREGVNQLKAGDEKQLRENYSAIMPPLRMALKQITAINWSTKAGEK